MEARRLTSFSHGAGCGCKLGPADLESLLGTLSMPELHPDVLVAADTGDDAAVVRLSDGQALVATLDFFTPIVDDPYDWGRIAATNALSDVYAMGARPILALNIALLVWVARDAKARGLDNSVLWMILVMITGPIGFVIYLFSRPKGELVACASCGNRRLAASARCPHCGNE